MKEIEKQEVGKLKNISSKLFKLVNPFHLNVPFWLPGKTLQSLCFSKVFMRHQKGTVGKNGLWNAGNFSLLITYGFEEISIQLADFGFGLKRFC